MATFSSAGSRRRITPATGRRSRSTAAAECPRFLNELIYPAVAPDDADLLQRWAGLALFGYNLPQRFLILDGTPNGGKGTLVRIIQALVGHRRTPTNCARNACMERFETYRYRGKTLLIGPDVRGDFLMQRGRQHVEGAGRRRSDFRRGQGVERGFSDVRHVQHRDDVQLAPAGAAGG